MIHDTVILKSNLYVCVLFCIRSFYYMPLRCCWVRSCFIFILATLCMYEVHPLIPFVFLLLSFYIRVDLSLYVCALHRAKFIYPPLDWQFCPILSRFVIYMNVRLCIPRCCNVYPKWILIMGTTIRTWYMVRIELFSPIITFCVLNTCTKNCQL